MKCQTCDGEVPSKFAHAFAQNICPLCGDQIMDPELQKMLNELRTVMTRAASLSFQEEVLDWLRQNFELLSFDSEEFQSLLSENVQLKIDLQEEKEKNKNSKPVPRSGKGFISPPSEVQLGTDEEGHQVQLQGESIQDQERTQVFLNRAGAGKMAERNNEIAKLANQIRKTGSPISESGATLASASPEEIEEMEAMLSGGTPGVSSGLQSDVDDDDDALPPIVEAMVRGQGSNSKDYNAKDVAKLQELQQKAARASRKLDGGGSVGLIKR